MLTRRTMPLFVTLAVACGQTAPLDTIDASAGGTPAASSSAPGRPDAPRGRRETCNGLDDDGDGKVDEGCPIRLTRNDGDDQLPSVSGTRLAWQRRERGDGGMRVSSIFVRDLKRGASEILVASNAVGPSLSGNRIAFLREKSIVVHDLDSGAEKIVWQYDDLLYAPVLDGDVVAWFQNEKDTEEDYEVYRHDLRTGVTTRVTQNPAIQMYPRLEGVRLAWVDDRRGHHTVGLLHLFDVYVEDEKGVRAVTNRTGDVQIESLAALEGGRVLFNELRGPLLDTGPKECVPVLVDVASGVRRELAPPSIECLRAMALSGNRAVFELEPQGVSDLVLIDVASGVRRQVTKNARRSTYPALEGSTLVWQDDRNDQWELYSMDLSDVDAGDFFPEGKAP